MQTFNRIAKDNNLPLPIPFNLLQQQLMLVEFLTVQKLMPNIF